MKQIIILAICIGFSLIVSRNVADVFQTAYSIGHVIMDSAGVPMVDYGNLSGVYVGLQRNPVTIDHVALSDYDVFKKYNDGKFRQLFLNNANWLVENAASHGNYSILQYEFPFPTYNLKSPWRSALAQAEALQVLIRAYEVSGKKEYLNATKMLLNSFFVEVKDGGVTYKTPGDGWWYEEYASDSTGSKHPKILNGMMTSLLGIHDYYNITHDAIAKYLFDKGLVALKNNLPSYDDNGWSHYDILGARTDLFYHKVHIDLLGRLYNITQDGIFKLYHDRWGNSLKAGGINAPQK